MSTVETRRGCPVIHDFDYSSAGTATSHMAMFDELRERFPAFYSTFGRGYTVLTNVELMRDAFQNPTVFSSTSNQVHNPELAYRLVPVTIDPPEHTTWRHLLTPYFSPAYVERLEPDGAEALHRAGRGAGAAGSLRLRAGLRGRVPDHHLHGPDGTAALRREAVHGVGGRHPPSNHRVRPGHVEDGAGHARRHRLLQRPAPHPPDRPARDDLVSRGADVGDRRPPVPGQRSWTCAC